MLSPCKDCEKRKLACHDHCIEYQAFRAEREQIRHLRYMESIKTNRDAQPFWKRKWKKNQIRKISTKE